MTDYQALMLAFQIAGVFCSVIFGILGIIGVLVMLSNKKK